MKSNGNTQIQINIVVIMAENIILFSTLFYSILSLCTRVCERCFVDIQDTQIEIIVLLQLLFIGGWMRLNQLGANIFRKKLQGMKPGSPSWTHFTFYFLQTCWVQPVQTHLICILAAAATCICWQFASVDIRLSKCSYLMPAHHRPLTIEHGLRTCPSMCTAAQSWKNHNNFISTFG